MALVEEYDELLEPDDPPGAHDEDERLTADADDFPRRADRDSDDAPGLGGAEHVGLTPPG